MVVVVLVAILAVVAVASYSRYMRNARRGDGLALMNDIRMKQETFFNTYSRYVSAPDPADENAYSGTKLGGDYEGYFRWEEACPDNSNGWCILGFNPAFNSYGDEDQLLYFQLQTIAWAPGVAAPSFIQNSNTRWWSVQARGLVDEGTPSLCTRLLLTSDTREAMIFGEETDCP